MDVRLVYNYVVRGCTIPEFKNDKSMNNKLIIAVIILQIGQHHRLKHEQQVFLHPIQSHVTIMIIIGKNNANPYIHGETHPIAVLTDVKLTSGCINDGTIFCIIWE
jgi:hypothetical protein